MCSRDTVPKRKKIVVKLVEILLFTDIDWKHCNVILDGYHLRAVRNDTPELLVRRMHRKCWSDFIVEWPGNDPTGDEGQKIKKNSYFNLLCCHLYFLWRWLNLQGTPLELWKIPCHAWSFLVLSRPSCLGGPTCASCKTNQRLEKKLCRLAGLASKLVCSCPIL